MTTKLLAFLNVKALPLFLAAVMLFNLSSASFAQLLPKEEEKKIDSYLMGGFAEQNQPTYWDLWKKSVKDLTEALERTRDIKSAFKGSAKEDKPQDEQKPMDKAAFAAQYNKEVASAEKAALKQFEVEKAKALAALQLDASSSPDEQAQRQAAFNDWQAQVNKQIADWKAAAAKELNLQYNQYVKEFNASAAQAQALSEKEVEAFVAKSANELMALYKKFPGNFEISSTLMELAPVIAMLETSDKKFFTAADKETIRQLYLNDLKTNDGCKMVVVKETVTYPGLDEKNGVMYVSHDTPYFPQKNKEYGFKSKAQCDLLLNSVMGLGFFGHDGDAYTIVAFMEANTQSSISVPTLLYGASALMAMGAYGPLRGFVHSAISKEEGKITFPSLSDLPAMIAYNGVYLGEVSKYTQYPIEGGAKGNAWEDLAYLLADDNTKESLEILSSAINCSVAYEGATFTDAGRFSCIGIKPFLLGAVLSGKTSVNSNTYKLAPFYGEHTQEFMTDGSVFNRTYAQVQDNRKKNAQRQIIFDNYIKRFNLNTDAFITRWLFTSDMGGIDTPSKFALDSKLYKHYVKVAPMGAPALQMYKKGDSVYRKKESLRSAVEGWTAIAIMADIALLVWAAWDLGRLGYKGYKLISSLSKAAKMVRAGATVTQRTTMLRQMGTARTLVKIRRGLRGGSFAASTIAGNFGIRRPQISADSFITGLPKAVVNTAAIPKVAVAAPVLADITSTGTLGSKISTPFKRTYQEIYYSVKGKDPFAPKAGLEQSSMFNEAALFNKKGSQLNYSSMKINDKGELVVDGEVQKLYKIAIDQKEFGSFVNLSRMQGYEKTVGFKAVMAGDKKVSFLKSPIRWTKDRFISAKESEYGIKLDVLDNMGNPMNATLSFNSSYGMAKGMANAKNVTFRGGKFWFEGSPLNVNLGLPKSELNYMIRNGVDFTKLPQISINYSKSKIGPIYMNMAMSFSAASSGLYFPLTNDPYRSMTEGTMHVPMITVILPYAFSFLSPVASGFVSKVGASKTQKLAMLAAAGGLGIAAAAGYNSKINNDDPPGLWPLYVASGVTGAASALGRASLGVLVKQMEVGNSMLKGMVFKNIGGLAMLLPPAVISAVGGEVDFSVAFPVLGAAALTTVGWMQFVKYPNNINKIPNFKYTLKGVAESYKMMGNSSVLPYIGAFTLYSAYEGQALFQTAPGLVKDKIGYSNVKPAAGDTPEEIDAKNRTKNYLALGSSALIALSPALTRWFAPKGVTNYGPNIIKATAASAAGGALLYTQKDGLDWRGAAGIGLMGYGTANMYVFLQKSMLARLEKAYLTNPAKFNVMRGGVSIARTYKQVETEALTAYTAANIGIALGPQLTSLYAKSIKDEAGSPVSQTEANRRSLWIPGIIIGGATAIAAKKNIISLPKLPFGLFKTVGEAAGLGYAGYNAWKIGSGNYNFNIAPQAVDLKLEMPDLKFNTSSAADVKLDAPAIAPAPLADDGQNPEPALAQ